MQNKSRENQEIGRNSRVSFLREIFKWDHDLRVIKFILFHSHRKYLSFFFSFSIHLPFECILLE